MGRDRWGGIGSVGREREKVRCSGSGTGSGRGGGSDSEGRLGGSCMRRPLIGSGMVVVVVGGEGGRETRGGLTISAQPAQAPADDLLRVRARKVVL